MDGFIRLKCLGRPAVLASVALATFLFASTAKGAIAVDTVNNGGAHLANNGTLTISHTTTSAGVNRYLLVGVSMNIAPDENATVASVTYDGILMNLIGVQNSTNGSNDRRIEMWELVNPPSGTFDVVVTKTSTGTGTVGVTAGAIGFTGVDQETPSRNFNSAQGSSNTPSVIVTSVANDVVVDTVAGRGDKTLTVGAGQTSRWNLNSGGTSTTADVRGGGSTEPGAGTVTMSWTLSGNSQRWAIGGVSLQPARADIGIFKSATPVIAAVGSTQTYEVTLLNNGPSTSTNVVVTDTLVVARLSFVSATSSQGTCSFASPTVTCSVGTMPATGPPVTITIVVSPTSAATVTNTATVTQTETDPNFNGANNSASVTTTIVASATPLCANPGVNGSPTSLSGIVNTYFPGTANASAGATSITIGAHRTGDANVAIAIGDLLLVMQMQDAAIVSANDDTYGANSHTGAGASALNNAGRYEYVKATNVVTTAGGTVNITGTGTGNGLNYAYTNADATTTQGARRFQVIRVPQYLNATLGAALTAIQWSTLTGATNQYGTGGVLAIDVAGTLNLNGQSVSVDGLGFRGGSFRQLVGTTGAAGFAATDFRTASAAAPANHTTGTVANGVNAPKGEGIAGTPEWIYDAAGNAALQTNQPNDGYPNGSNGRGAPGNAGGGGTDSSPTDNSENSGGGGGGNGGAGARGGNSWAANEANGGIGGSAYPAAIDRVIMGGGGGAGTRNNSDNMDPASAGAAGGGIIFFRAQQVTGTGTLSANGSDAVDSPSNDAAGGGGAGGSVIVASNTGDLNGLTVKMHGGKGANAWATHNPDNACYGYPPLGSYDPPVPGWFPYNVAGSGPTTYLGVNSACTERHGPGGGGGGGVAILSFNPTVAPDVSGAQSGTTTTASDAYGTQPGGNGGIAIVPPFNSIPGPGGGADCSTDPAITKTHSGTFIQGQTATFTLHISNAAVSQTLFGTTAGTITVTDTLPTTPDPLTPVSATGTGWGPGTNACSISGQTVTCTRTTTLAAGASYPDITVTVTVGSTATGTDVNTANLAVTGGGSFADVNTTNDSASDSVIIQSPTIATLRAFHAIRKGAQVSLEWQTSYEVRNLGFEIVRDQNGQQTTITPGPIAGSALMVGSFNELRSGMSYRWIDTDPGPRGEAAYWLRDIDLDGSTRLSGPYSQEEEQATALFPVSRTESRDSGISPLLTNLPASVHPFKFPDGFGAPGSEFVGRAETEGARVESARAKPGVSSQAQQWTLAGQPAAKILVNHEGWFRVTRNQLSGAGFDPGSSSTYLQLFVEGQQIPILVNDGGDGSFDGGDSIEFYGTGLDTPSTDTRVYWLVQGTSPGLRVSQASVGGGQSGPANFPFTVERKDRTVYFINLTTNGDNENFFGAVLTSTPTDESLSVVHLDSADSGSSTLEVSLQGATTGVTHQVDVQLNGHDLGAISFQDQDAPTTDFPVPTSWLVEGDNHIVLAAQGGSLDVSVVDYITLTYPHLYEADSGALKFTAPGNSQITVGGFASASVRVLDVSNPAAVRQVPVSVSPEGGGFSASLVTPASSTTTLLAVEDDRVSTDGGIVLNAPSSLNKKTNQAALVIIAHPSFIPAVAPLAALRQKQGLRTMVVDVNDVYDEFNYGEKSPQAIRDFLSYAVASWKGKGPQYALLVGDASYDERDYYAAYGFAQTDFVPTKLVPTTYLKTASDDWFVDFNDDGIPDLPIGRLPAQTPGDAASMVSKITGYPQSSGAWLKKILIAVDKNDDNDFTGLAQSLAQKIPKGYVVQTFLRDALDPSTMHDDVVAGINSGQLLVNYIGHGSEQTWGKTTFFENSDALALTDGSTLPVVISMDCLNGLFQDPVQDTLAEVLLKDSSTGAVAVWASSALTEPVAQGQMDRALYAQLLKAGPPRIGDAMLTAKKATNDQDVRRTWILFGDPTMYLAR
ncbi:MAG: C25 family cysteine peptidase [Thermoanaerobaculia bacterium]